MKLENQVCSLKLAKKLKKLGVKQDGLFCYVPNPDGKTLRLRSMEDRGTCGRDAYISAFTVAELGEWFRDNYPIYIDQETVTVGGFWRIDFGDQQMVTAKTEANARAKMLIYLLENKLLKEGK